MLQNINQLHFMKKTLLLLASLIFVLASTVLCKLPKNDTSTPLPTEILQEKYLQDILALQKEVQKLQVTLQNSTDTSLIQQQFLQARKAYKRIEFLVELYNPALAKGINGAAIDEVEEDDPLQKIVPPSGFQVIEELIFPTFLVENQALALQEIGILLSTVSRLHKTSAYNQMTDSHIFDALRLELFRLVALGITGFDMPIAQRSMTEIDEVLTSIYNTVHLYENKIADKKAIEKFDATLKNAIAFAAQNTDFNSFDRMTFIQQFANPLGEQLVVLQNSAKIAFFQEKRLLHPQAKSLFSPQFYSPYYFAAEQDTNNVVAKAELGEKLFFEPLISGNNSVSCATCHQPQKGFADGQKVGRGIRQQALLRNTPTLLNVALQANLFADSRVSYLEDQIAEVIANKEEMHSSVEKATQKINQLPVYQTLSKNAFGNKTLQPRQLSEAIAAYLRKLTLLNSRFDRYMQGDHTALNSIEIQGFNLFMGKAKCATCHFVPLFNGTVPPDFSKTEAEILGVPAKPTFKNATLDKDTGKFMSTKIRLHQFAFKTPTLRNVAQTAPYMHNGVYQTLTEVVEFYNKGGGAGIGINLATQTLPTDPLNLTEKEKIALVSFLETLDDER